MDYADVLENVERVSAGFAKEGSERRLRRELVDADFERLRRAGFLLTGVPVEMGGLWESTARSTRPVCEILRTLARGDSSVGLVASMHPAVLSFWLATPDAPSSYQEAWVEQRAWVCETARDGAWWGTITSEPGSGGDITRTRAVARRPSGGEYTLTGQKQFGSGLGNASYMITTALVDGTDTPELFFLDMRDVAWDGSAGATLTAPWDGHGMIATQSHGMKFEDFAARRCAWPENLDNLAEAANPFINCLFSSVFVGITEAAVDAARERLAGRMGSFRPYESVEWTRIETEGWLARQAYDGMLRAVENGRDSLAVSVRGKAAIAELAESATRRICRVLGGGTFSRHSPFGFWFEDVRALGFLRPPWALAYDKLFEWSWPT